MTSNLLSRIARTLPVVGMVAASMAAGAAPLAIADDSITAAPAASSSSPAQAVFGAIAGVVRSSSKLPVVGAMVTAARADGKGIWTTISGTDGIYSIANIAPGEYQITTQAEGYPDPRRRRGARRAARGAARRAARRSRGKGGAARRALADKMRMEKLSGQVLNARSGALRGSIAAEAGAKAARSSRASASPATSNTPRSRNMAAGPPPMRSCRPRRHALAFRPQAARCVSRGGSTIPGSMISNAPTCGSSFSAEMRGGDRRRIRRRARSSLGVLESREAAFSALFRDASPSRLSLGPRLAPAPAVERHPRGDAARAVPARGRAPRPMPGLRRRRPGARSRPSCSSISTRAIP